MSLKLQQSGDLQVEDVMQAMRKLSGLSYDEERAAKATQHYDEAEGRARSHRSENRYPVSKRTFNVPSVRTDFYEPQTFQPGPMARQAQSMRESVGLRTAERRITQLTEQNRRLETDNLRLRSENINLKNDLVVWKKPVTYSDPISTEESVRLRFSKLEPWETGEREKLGR